ncbi:hypothetical protein [Bacteroides sp.]
MIIEFENEFLNELYIIGRYMNKACAYSTVTVDRYKIRVDALMAADNVEQLKGLKSWDLRATDGEGGYSARLDYGYSLKFRVNKSVCTLIDITENS